MKAKAKRLNMSRPLHQVPPQKQKPPATPSAKTDLAALREQLKESARVEAGSTEHKSKMAIAMVNARFAQPECQQAMWQEKNPSYKGRSTTIINVKPGMGPVQ